MGTRVAVLRAMTRTRRPTSSGTSTQGHADMGADMDAGKNIRGVIMDGEDDY